MKQISQLFKLPVKTFNTDRIQESDEEPNYRDDLLNVLSELPVCPELTICEDFHCATTMDHWQRLAKLPVKEISAKFGSFQEKLDFSEYVDLIRQIHPAPKYTILLPKFTTLSLV